MAATSLTGEPLDTFTPITELAAKYLFAKNEIVNEWFLDPNRKKTFASDFGSLPYGSWKQMSVKNDTNNGTTFEDSPSSTKEQAFEESLQDRIFYKLSFPNHWGEEGINRPNLAAKNNALQICKELLKYNIYPDKILPTKEEGIYITYDAVNENGNYSLVIETYNDAETAIVVRDNANKKILHSEDINNFDFKNAVRIFKETNA